TEECAAREPGEESFEWISRWIPARRHAHGKLPWSALDSKRSRLNCTCCCNGKRVTSIPGQLSQTYLLKQANVSGMGLRTWVEAGEKRCAHEGDGDGITA